MPKWTVLRLALAALATLSCKHSEESTGRRTDPVPAVTASLGVLSTVSAEDDGDALVIKQLRAARSKLGVPVPVDFYLYLPTQHAAETVAAAMRNDGYVVDVRAPEPSIPSWACVATKTMVITPSTMRHVRVRLTALAKQSGGEYDGWEAPVAR